MFIEKRFKIRHYSIRVLCESAVADFAAFAVKNDIWTF